jgi:hypothetical protein
MPQVIAALLSALAACAVLINVLLTSGKVASILCAVISFGWLAFLIVMFRRNRTQKSEKTDSVKALSLGKIPFDYLPYESPLAHG